MAYTTRPKVELRANVPAVMSFDPEPFKDGVNQWGKKWFGYRVVEAGTEKTYFASEYDNQKIQFLIKQGCANMRILKTERADGKGFSIEIKSADNPEAFGAELDKQVVKEHKNDEDVKWEKIRDEKTQNIKQLNALNNATMLVANGKTLNDLEKVYEIAKKLYYWEIEPDDEINLSDIKNL